MELNQFKDIWQEESKQLEQRIELSETLLRKMNLEKATGEFDRLLNLSILGRNLALVYCLISIVVCIATWHHWQYSVPALFAAAAMLGSFISHLPIARPDYATASVLALQKAICKFRIHTIALQPYDTGITIFWALATWGGVLFKTKGVDLWSLAAPAYLWTTLAVFVASTLLYSRFVYRHYSARLKRSEAQLEEILVFEKNTREELP